MFFFRPQPEWVVDSKYTVHKFHTSTGAEAGGNPPPYSTRVLLFPGVSGAGKTFAAVTLADDTIRALCGSGFESATVLGCYTVARRSICVDVWAARTLRRLFETHCEYPGEFGKLAVHVVIDEVGGLPHLVREIVASAPELAPSQTDGNIPLQSDAKNHVAEGEGGGLQSSIEDAIIRELRGWFEATAKKALPLDCVRVIISLVGTGVGRPDRRGDSLLPKYLVCRVSQELAREVFVKAIVATRPPDAEGSVRKLVAELAKDPLFGAMMTNARCGVLAGVQVGMALKYCDAIEFVRQDDNAVSLVGDAWADSVVEYLRAHAESIVTHASLKYFTLNGWANVNLFEKTNLMTSLVSLLVTQPHGYHLVSDREIDDLCCAVGAIEDTLQWTSDPSRVAWDDENQTAIKRNDLCKRAMAAGASPCVPNVRENLLGHVYPHVSGPRFVVPPAIAATVLLVAMSRNFYPADLLGSHPPSAMYEKASSTVIWCTLEALRRRCTTTAGAHAYYAPAVLAFPSLAEHFPLRAGIEEVLFEMGWLTIPFVLPPATSTEYNETVKGESPTSSSAPRKQQPRTLSCIENVKTFLSSGHGMVLEMAGAGCPRNHLTIINPGGVCIGVMVSSRRRSIVDRHALERRCFQMGYNKMSVVGEEGEERVVEVEKHDNPRNLLGRFVTLLTEKNCKAPTREYLFLCSPMYGNAVLPSHTTVEFRERVIATSTSNSGAWMSTAMDSARVPCQVVCLHLDLEDLLHGCCCGVADLKYTCSTTDEPSGDDDCSTSSTSL